MNDLARPEGLSPVAPRRVLSPHLQVYRLPLNAWLSILHRITGVLWALALVGATGLLWALATGGGDRALAWLVAPPGQALLLLLVFALAFHWAAGLRHLLMDLGFGFAPSWRRVGGWAVPIAAFLITLLAWVR